MRSTARSPHLPPTCRSLRRCTDAAALQEPLISAGDAEAPQVDRVCFCLPLLERLEGGEPEIEQHLARRAHPSSKNSARLVAVAHGNRTHRGRLSSPATGFEDRAGHQIRTRYRGGK